MEDESVLERIVNGDEDPRDLPLALLRSITNDFSQERKIGEGGFGEVYKGVLRNGIIVAVKRLYVNEHTADDVLFRRQFNSLIRTNHQNVVRFLGFCSNTYQTTIQGAGSEEIWLASVKERLLCFEYIKNGSLDKHITDELRGLEWETRYEIITGICKGLCYLHNEKYIIHMDLAPANILLDDHMVPKIADFDLSRPSEKSHTDSMGKRFGKRQYVAPEYDIHGQTSVKSDIYTLGITIIELITGRISFPNKNNVLRRWRHRWSKPPTVLQYHQVTRCIEIALRCRKREPEHRPSITEIISILTESESMDGQTSQISPCFDEDDMLEIKPLELRLPSKLNKEISCSVELTNDTPNCIAFNILLPSVNLYIVQPKKGIVQPESKYDVKIIVQAHYIPHHDYSDRFIVESMKVCEVLRDEDITEHMFYGEIDVDEVDLMVVYEHMKPQESCKSGEETNMPAEEVPKRDIIESASEKGELGSSEKRDIIEYASEKGELGSSGKEGMVRSYDELEEKLQDPNAKPMPFPMEFLKAITCDFSRESILGEGGFGAVYKGVLRSGKTIAVKKLFETRVKEEAFRNEVSCLMKIKHQNLVQFLGYCAESNWEAIEPPSGSQHPIFAETPKRLLCFEYVSNKSLDKHISDESSGLEWNMRYEIIKGICTGLCFLHEECHIIHLDLKPENILMDSTMLPKIADFGFSRIFGKQQSRTVTNNTVGTRGYIAPEYLNKGVVSYKADIFSVGVIIIEIITGGRDYPWDPYFQQDSPRHTDPSFQQFTEKVLGSWENKFVSTPNYKPVEKYTQQVKQCVAIALKCLDPSMEKRPTVKDIIDELNAENQIGDTHFEMRECICYPRDQLLELREITDVAEEILRVKQEIDAKLYGEGQSWDCNDSDVQAQTQGQAQYRCTETDNHDCNASTVQPPGPAVDREMDWEDQLSSQFASKAQICSCTIM